MEKLRGIPHFNYSWNNRYASEYQNAYRNGVKTQEKIAASEHNPHLTVTEREKLQNELQKWRKKVENYTRLVKAEEQKLVTENQKTNQNGSIDFMA